jgi:hypothetical protein
MYRIVRHYFRSYKHRIIRRGLSLEEAQRHCSDPETSSSTCQKSENVRRGLRYGPWFDGYEEAR